MPEVFLSQTAERTSHMRPLYDYQQMLGFELRPSASIPQRLPSWPMGLCERAICPVDLERRALYVTTVVVRQSIWLTFRYSFEHFSCFPFINSPFSCWFLYIDSYATLDRRSYFPMCLHGSQRDAWSFLGLLPLIPHSDSQSAQKHGAAPRCCPQYS